MDPKYIIGELQKNKFVFKSLLEDTDPGIYLWRFDPEKWCLLEIVCHLYDEEREDFRARLNSVLHTPGVAFTSINPVGWVAERKYLEQDYNLVLKNFLNEREDSVQWLMQLKDQKWDNKYNHPTLGELSGALIFSNWLAHDYLHIRQITRLKYEYLKRNSGEDLSYAGTW